MERPNIALPIKNATQMKISLTASGATDAEFQVIGCQGFRNFEKSNVINKIISFLLDKKIYILIRWHDFGPWLDPRTGFKLRKSRMFHCCRWSFYMPKQLPE